LGAQIYTRSDGMALDIFKVTGYFEHGISEDKQDDIRRDIKRALEGKISLEYRIAEKAKRYLTKGILKGTPNVEVDNASSDFYTIIEVHAEDRIGLLYSITRVMHDLNLDIHLAKVSTNVDKVIDVFYVWDINGQKLYDEEQINDVKRAILMTLN
jgi:[protein-PII] uridylyltransferase